MEKIMNYKNLRNFTYSNDHLVKEIKGIVIDFKGLNNVEMFNNDTEEAIEYAKRGIIFLNPYYNPWSWMNDDAIDFVNEIIDVLCVQYDLNKSIKIVSTGGSMGGLSALIYTVYAKIKPCACVVNCPVCDLPFHYGERDDLPRTLYTAFKNFNGSLMEALILHSPYHLINKMPQIPFTIFHCEKDEAVDIEKHSVRFVEQMKINHQIELIRVPNRGHCNLTKEAKEKYYEKIYSYFEK